MVLSVFGMSQVTLSRPRIQACSRELYARVFLIASNEHRDKARDYVLSRDSSPVGTLLCHSWEVGMVKQRRFLNLFLGAVVFAAGAPPIQAQVTATISGR